MIDVTCDRDYEDACKKYFYFNGIWYATCKISRELKRSLEKSEDLPDFEELPENFKNYLYEMIEKSKSKRALGRNYFAYQKMKEISELDEEQLELEPPKELEPPEKIS